MTAPPPVRAGLSRRGLVDGRSRHSWDCLLGLAAAVFGLLALFAWIPADTETGLVETYRRQTSVGDALMPSAIAVLMVVLGVVQIVAGVRRSASAQEPQPGGVLTARHLRFLLWLGAVVGASLLIMRYAGPAAVAAFGEPGAAYREVRDTLPWKLVGFVLGGTALTAGLHARLAGGVRLRAVGLWLLGTTALALLYDLPFEDLLLPPNGDL